MNSHLYSTWTISQQVALLNQRVAQAGQEARKPLSWGRCTEAASKWMLTELRQFHPRQAADLEGWREARLISCRRLEKIRLQTATLWDQKIYRECQRIAELTPDPSDQGLFTMRCYLETGAVENHVRTPRKTEPPPRARTWREAGERNCRMIRKRFAGGSSVRRARRENTEWVHCYQRIRRSSMRGTSEWDNTSAASVKVLGATLSACHHFVPVRGRA